MLPGLRRTVYVLLGFHYGGFEAPIGVYDTKRMAEKTKLSKRTVSRGYDYLKIFEIEVVPDPDTTPVP